MIIKHQFNYRENIVNTLVLQSFFTEDLGLIKGKMGIALSLFEYSRFLDNEVLMDFANNLLDNIMENLDENLSYSFGYGLAGIGWGIEYLIQNEYVEGSSIEICEEIDRKIMETDPKRIIDLSLETGVEGLLHYVIFHSKGIINQDNDLPFDEQYLTDIHILCNRLKEVNVSKELEYLLNIYNRLYTDRIIEGYNFDIVDFSNLPFEIMPKEASICALGIKDGLSSMLLNYIKSNR